MMTAHLVTDADLLRARTDPQFRQELLAESLETLLAALKRVQRGDIGPDTARQMKEGAALAVQLADRLQRLGIVPRATAA
jgi:hypothetical protein